MKFSEIDIKNLQDILGFFVHKKSINYYSFLDHNITGYISQYKFSEFLKGFGPFDKSIENVQKILAEPYVLFFYFCIHIY